MTVTKYIKSILIVVFLFTITLPIFAGSICMDTIKLIESSGNPNAISFRGARYGRGAYQISEILLKEWNNFHPNEQYTTECLFTYTVNRRIAYWYVFERIPSMLHHYDVEVTTETILHAYNAGIGRVVDGVMPDETKEYIRKYYYMTGGGE